MNLHEYLYEADETAAAFAERAGLSESAVSRLRNGETWPDPPTIQAVLTASGNKITLDGLYQAWHRRNPPKDTEAQPAA